MIILDTALMKRRSEGRPIRGEWPIMPAQAGSITQLEPALLGRMGAIRRETLLPLDLALACTIHRHAPDTPLPFATVSISTGD